MTKRELIVALSQYDDDLDVLTAVGSDSWGRRVTAVVGFKYENGVVILQRPDAPFPKDAAFLILCPFPFSPDFVRREP